MTAKFYMYIHYSLKHLFVLTITFYYTSLSPITLSFTGSKIIMQVKKNHPKKQSLKLKAGIKI